MVEWLLKRRANANVILAANILMISLQAICHCVNCFDKKAQLWFLLVVLRQIFISYCAIKKRENVKIDGNFWARKKFRSERALHVLFPLFEQMPHFHEWKASTRMKRNFLFLFVYQAPLSPTGVWGAMTNFSIRYETIFFISFPTAAGNKFI